MLAPPLGGSASCTVQVILGLFLGHGCSDAVFGMVRMVLIGAGWCDACYAICVTACGCMKSCRWCEIIPRGAARFKEVLVVLICLILLDS